MKLADILLIRWFEFLNHCLIWHHLWAFCKNFVHNPGRIMQYSQWFHMHILSSDNIWHKFRKCFQRNWQNTFFCIWLIVLWLDVVSQENIKCFYIYCFNILDKQALSKPYKNCLIFGQTRISIKSYTIVFRLNKQDF